MAKGGSGKVISMAEKMYIKQLYEDGGKIRKGLDAKKAAKQEDN